jgi:hypothetical protein
VKRYLLLATITLTFTLFSCKNDITVNDVLIECPSDIANKALFYAHEYADADTEYEWGGQDLLRAIKIDCSGLVVNCYSYAMAGTDYSLPFKDASVIDLYNKWTVQINNPRPGDVIFMGDDKNHPTHMSLFKKKEKDNIYFIDSTYKQDDEIDGVTERYYSEKDPRFLAYGILFVNYHPK